MIGANRRHVGRCFNWKKIQTFLVIFSMNNCPTWPNTSSDIIQCKYDIITVLLSGLLLPMTSSRHGIMKGPEKLNNYLEK